MLLLLLQPRGSMCLSSLLQHKVCLRMLQHYRIACRLTACQRLAFAPAFVLICCPAIASPWLYRQVVQGIKVSMQWLQVTLFNLGCTCKTQHRDLGPPILTVYLEVRQGLLSNSDMRQSTSETHRLGTNSDCLVEGRDAGRSGTVPMQPTSACTNCLL